MIAQRIYYHHFFSSNGKKISFLLTSRELILAIFKDVDEDNFLILAASLTIFNFILSDKL